MSEERVKRLKSEEPHDALSALGMSRFTTSRGDLDTHIAMLMRVPDKRANKVRAEQYPDWTWCLVHKRLCSANVSSMHRNNPNVVDRACGQCLVNEILARSPAVFRFPLPLTDGQFTLADYESVHKHWEVEADALKHARSRSNESELAMHIERETTAWTLYQRACFQHARQNVYDAWEAYIAKADDKQRLAAKRTIHQWMERIRTFTRAMQRRHGINGAPQLYCFAHRRLGDMFPLAGVETYLSCGVCMADNPFEVVSDAPDTANIASAAADATMDD